MRRALAVALGLALAGCGGVVSGEVDAVRLDEDAGAADAGSLTPAD